MQARLDGVTVSLQQRPMHDLFEAVIFRLNIIKRAMNSVASPKDLAAGFYHKMEKCKGELSGEGTYDFESGEVSGVVGMKHPLKKNWVFGGKVGISIFKIDNS